MIQDCVIWAPPDGSHLTDEPVMAFCHGLLAISTWVKHGARAFKRGLGGPRLLFA